MTLLHSTLHPVQQPPTRVGRYLAPASLDQALEVLDRLGPRARPVAGGTDLLVELDRGDHGEVEVLVDLSRIGGLADIDRVAYPVAGPRGGPDRGEALRLGPLVTHHQVVASPLAQSWALPLAQACLEVGSPQLRNRATVAGNVITASPANDTLSALTVLEAQIELTSRAGVRTLTLDEFVTGFRTTALASGELVTAIIIPRPRPGTRGLFVKAGLRQAQAISVVHLAATITVEDAQITAARLALGSVAPTVVSVPAAAEALIGRPLPQDQLTAASLDPDVVDQVVAAAVDAASPIDDLRASARYRLALVATMTGRALAALATDRQRDWWPADQPLLWGSGFTGRFPSLTGPVEVTPDQAVEATVNGQRVSAPGAAGVTLLDWLRDRAGLPGVKEGCAEGECGACTIDLDGAAVLACLIPAGRAAGAAITTVEGVAGPDPQPLHPLQEAMVGTGAVQCGFCTPGFVMAGAKLWEEVGGSGPSPTQIRAGLAGNLCRCTGYKAIETAVALAGPGAGGQP